MTWIDNINELEYYYPIHRFDCYGDMLFTPYDLILQGQLPVISSNSYTITVSILSTDGLTVYMSDITSYFNKCIGLNTDGVPYFNLQLKKWHDAMCTYGCFILQVQVKDEAGVIRFNKYTQKYSVENCCVRAEGVTIDDPDGNDLAVDCSPSNTFIDNCGGKYIKMYTTFNCIDNYTGDYYGLPVTPYSLDTPFKFYKVSWLQASVYYMPVTIKTTISINCRLQKTELTPTWQMEGRTSFPLWKVQELELMFGAENINIDGKDYKFPGGTVFERISKSNCRVPYDFKMNTTLNECYEFQLFGCSTACDA